MTAIDVRPAGDRTGVDGPASTRAAILGLAHVLPAREIHPPMTESLAHPVVVAPAASPTRSAIRRLWRVATWGYTVSLAVQTFFAGMFVFVGAELLDVHKTGAHVVGLMAILTVVTAFAGRLDRKAKRQSLALFGLLVVQGGLVHLLVVSPWIAAFHPVNALILFWAAFTVARGSREAIERSEGAAVPVRVARRRFVRLGVAPEPVAG
jgi:Family of unknown function (DUF6220)